MTQFVTVCEYAVRSDAVIAVSRLAADGIVAAVRADDEGGLNPGFYRRYAVRVEVEASDVLDAYESLGIEHVELPAQIAAAMVGHGVFSFPQEACGLVAFDRHHRVAFVAALTNVDGSERRFTIDPNEHHGVVRFCEARGWTIGAVFHSHPRSEAYPSDTDLTGGADPDWLHFIVGPINDARGRIRAFRVDADKPVEVAVTTVE